MGIIDFVMMHECQVQKSSHEHHLNFTNGTKAFLAGSVLTGSTSHATATINSVTLSSGSWTGGTAAGELSLYSVSGTFTTGETITDSQLTKGSAKASGSNVPQTNDAGTPTNVIKKLPSDSTYYDCLFETKGTAGNYILDSEAGKTILTSIIVSLPSTADISEGDLILTTESGWAGTYEVQKVDAPEIPFSGIVDHKEAILKKVEKRQT